MGKLTHGYSIANGPLYRCWLGIKRRCYNKNDSSYKNYGGRGITVCEEWRISFPCFNEWALSAGWEKGLTIERIDFNKGYCPDNCDWITKGLQTRNTRRSKLIQHNGQKLTAKEWAEITGISMETIRRRIFIRNWDIHSALTTPPESSISNNKITEVDALDIFNSQETANVLAVKYGVTRAAIWAVKRGSTWTHITGKEFSRKNKYPFKSKQP